MGPGPACAGFIAGVALQLQQPALWPATWYAAAVLPACALAGLLWCLGGRVRMASWGRVGLAFVLAAMLGFGATGWRAGVFQSAGLDPALEGRDIEVIGRVLAMPQPGEDGVRFRLGVESARLDGRAVTLPPQILLGWYSGFGGREAALPAQDADPSEVVLALQRQPQPLRAGERWQMTVRLKAPHGNSNPHGFDYELWLWEQGLQATGYVRAGVHDAPPARLSGSWHHPVEQARQAVREAIFERVENRQLAGVIAALVVGDQNAIERADWDVFRATGVAHLMSISGLHITMFAWAASLLIGGLWRRSARLTPRLCLALPAGAAGALGGLLLAALYALFSGWGVPAQRTIWMLAVVILLRHGGRQWPWAQTWVLAMAVVVALDPWALMQAGFWLSFVAVGVLFATNSGAATQGGVWAGGQFGIEDSAPAVRWRRHLPRWLAGLAGALREQWVVTLAFTPLSLLLFNQVSLVGLVANAVAIPLVTLVVTPLALLGVVWAPVWLAAAWVVGVLAAFLQGLAGWPWASVSVAAAPLWCAVAGVAGGGLLATRLPWRWRALGFPLLLPVVLWQPARMPPGQFELLAADIGQGNAVLVRTASHSLLYDAGPRFSRESDAGHRVLVPLLRALGERLDVLMVSHRDTDHIGGAATVLAMQPEARLISSIEETHPLQALRKAGRCVAGQRWEWDGVAFEVLHPAAADYGVVGGKSNAMSCVLRIGNGSRTALLVGDIESPQELALATANPAGLKADVLLMPHHGSKTSSSAVFLDAVKPQWAVAQAGYRNRFGHPVDSVVARYEARGIRLVKSPQCGAASWSSQQPEIFQCQREEGKRYWHHVP
ncbi:MULTISPECIES: DNA internalization-related competence protein ComEC/Rec2 [unclassified Polaromonas]|uniref:DNA internalization-related competence protein ComEC/Rec2 n=1 Tax=unclassified Polaromonas TaxID=2638319 RepID=UPI000F07A4A7|nr:MULTISPECIES: DNA internalization-related competence protein ComEC/Rec2 [unclassified Polaromonas]AYQ29086.1 DNA internalization-related competence protein ComEC/Rec2 [Polaromonas sp. SP1]QGJ20891.1 DNA internalization-related competence protein ComEC/Rec2 [Polaromonas sp. Pch-P]